MNATTAMKSAMFAAALGATAAQAATWTNGNWSVAENWAEGVVPAPHGYVFPGGSCHVRSQLDECFTPGEPVYWELWLSLKFEGPRYKGSKAKENRVWYDRTLLVRVKNGNRKTENGK